MRKNYSNEGTKARSIANLIHEGRPAVWGEVKHRHNISVTDEAWELLQQKAELNGQSVSDLLEHFARDYALRRRRTGK